MPDPKSQRAALAKALNVFFVLDVSGSMLKEVSTGGTSIGRLNNAMVETVRTLQKAAKEHDSATLNIAILSYSSGAQWLTPNGPVYVEDFFYDALDAGGVTDMGAALKELNVKLSRKQFLDAIAGNYMPVIIFMTDGHATDNWQGALKEIYKNKWFRRSVKIGFAIGDDPDEQMIADIVGNKKCVIKLSDLDIFEELIKFTTVTSSMLSGSSQVNDEGAADSIAKEVIDIAIKEGKLDKDSTLENRDDISAPPPPPPEDNEPFGKGSYDAANPDEDEAWKKFYEDITE